MRIVCGDKVFQLRIRAADRHFALRYVLHEFDNATIEAFAEL